MKLLICDNSRTANYIILSIYFKFLYFYLINNISVHNEGKKFRQKVYDYEKNVKYIYI